MDLIELKPGYLAENTNGIYFDNWFIYDWPPRMFSYFEKSINLPERIQFTIGDDHAELYNFTLVQEPLTHIDPVIGGRLMTLFMQAKFNVKNATFKGKMCLRNLKNESPLVTEFELELRKADILQTVGFIIRGDSLLHNLCLYEFSNIDLSLTYCSDSKVISILDRETDSFKRKLLEKYLVEILLEDICKLIQDHEIQQLGIKQTVSNLCGECYKSRDILRTHNRISHVAIKNLANHVINLTNDLIEKTAKKLHLSRIYGLSKDNNNLKAYTAYISNLHSISFNQLAEDYIEEVIIGKSDGCFVLYVPVKFWEISLHYKEVEDGAVCSPDEFKNKQIYEIDRAFFKLSLKKDIVNEVELKLLEFKIMNIKPIGSNYPVEMAMDHLVFLAIEEYVKSMMEKTFTDKKLRELALDKNVHVEDDGDNLYESDSESNNSDND